LIAGPALPAGRPPPAKATGRVGNLALAIHRFGRVWAPGVPSAAWREFRAMSPVWRGGVIFIVLSALLLDGPSVAWARALPEPIRAFFEWLTDFGKSGWLLSLSGVVGLVLLCINWGAVSRRVAAAWTEVGIIAGFAFWSIAGSGILANVIKQLVGRARPNSFDEKGAFSFLPLQFDYAHASFPSGHATTVGALAVIVAVVAPRLIVPAAVFCGLVAVSRVAVGAHYPSDVVGGFLWGAAYTWFYALALTEAGIGFARGPGGIIKARVVAIRTVFWRSRGLQAAALDP
jgi:membrane-associated phospholipid phosphatase